MKQMQATCGQLLEDGSALPRYADLADFTADQDQAEAQPELRHQGKEGKIRPQVKPGGKKRKSDEEPAGGWTAFFDTSRAGRPADKVDPCCFVPEGGGPSEPQPREAAAIDRLDEVDTGGGLFK
jgi:hypothetical protein